MNRDGSPLAVASKGLRPWLILSLLCALLYLPGLASLPPTDRDEARYIQASRQMVETGDYTRIFFQDSPRHKKPIGIYWMQAVFVRTLSSADSTERWPYRLPSTLAAWISVLALFYLGSQLFDRKVALVAAAQLASCVTLVAEAHLAKTDAVLLCCCVICLGILGVSLSTARNISLLQAIFFWVALGFGTLVKGPVLPGILGLTAFTFCLRRHCFPKLMTLRPIAGIPVAALIVLPWLLSIEQKTSGAFLLGAVQGDILPKLLGAHESHFGPPGYYFVSAFVAFWPWTFLVLPSLGRAWRERVSPQVAYCLAWIIPAWILLELIPTKLPHYTLPLFPALALLSAGCMVGGISKARSSRLSWWLWVIVSALLLMTPMAFPLYFERSVSLLGVLTTLIGLALLLLYSRPLPALLPLGLAVLLFGSFFGWVFPATHNFWISSKLSPLAGPAPVVAGYSEPSIVFLAGTATRLVSSEKAATIARAECARRIAVRDRDLPSFLAAAGKVQELGKVRGFNYSKGRWQELTVYESKNCK